MKSLLREKFVDGMADAAIAQMAKIAKGEDMSKIVSQLDAVLVKRSEAKPGEKNARSARKGKPTDPADIAVQRGGNNVPRSGGF